MIGQTVILQGSVNGEISLVVSNNPIIEQFQLNFVILVGGIGNEEEEDIFIARPAKAADGDVLALSGAIGGGVDGWLPFDWSGRRQGLSVAGNQDRRFGLSAVNLPFKEVWVR